MQKLIKRYLTYTFTFMFAFSTLITASSSVYAKSYRSSSSSFSSSRSWSSSKSSYKPAKTSFNRKTNDSYRSKSRDTKSYNTKTYGSNKSNTTVKKQPPKAKPKVLTKAQRDAKQRKASQAAKNKKAAMERKVASNQRAKVQKAIAPKKLTPAQTVKAQKSFRKDPAYSSIASKPMSRYDYDRQRSNYYDRSDWRPAPYVVHSSPSFGMWDAMFMWMMLDNISKPAYANTYYNNQNSPAYREWRAEADRLSRDNAELRAKLNAMDSQMATQTGTPVPGTVGEGIPVAAYASQVAATTPDLSQFKMGVGSDDGMYRVACDILKAADNENSVNFNCMKTEGTGQILEGILNGSLDGGFIQGDTLVKFADKLDRLDALQATAYEEYVFLVTAKDSNVESIKDFAANPQYKLYTMGSGARYTMHSFATMDKDYVQAANGALKNKVPMIEKSFGLIKNKKDAAVMVVCALDCPLMRNLEESSLANDLRIVPVNDWNFNEKKDRFGNLVYNFKDISSVNYPNMIPKKMMGMVDSTVETITLESVFVASNAWLEAKSEDARLMMEFMLESALPEIKKQAGDSI